MKVFNKVIIYSFIFASFYSCIGLKDVKYLQDNENLVLNDKGYIQLNDEPYRLRVDDWVTVNIETTDPEANLVFGKNVMSPATSSPTSTQSRPNGAQNSEHIAGNQIKADGKVNIYGLGFVDVAGLTTDELSSKIQNIIEQKYYLKEKSIVHVYLTNTSFFLMGEVGAGGRITLNKSKVTLLEALASGGDLPKFADRKKIHIYRHYPEGLKRTDVDITQNSILNSIYFYVHPNDIIIVDPRPEKISGIGGNTTLADITQFLSIATQSLFMYYTIKNIK